MYFHKRTSLLLILGSLLTISFLGLSFFNYTTARQSLQEEIVTSSLPLLRENIYSEIQRDLLPAVNIASAMAHDSFLINWVAAGEKNSPEILQYLTKIKTEYGYFSTFFVSSKSLNYYHFSGVKKQISSQDTHDVWYYNFINSGKKYALDVDVDEAGDHKLTIFINFRVLDFDGNLLGVTGVGLEMGSISQSLLLKQKQFHRTIYMTDEAGTIQAHSDPTLIEARNLRQAPGLRDIAEQLLGKTADPQNMQYTLDNELYLISSRYIPELDWFLVVEQKEAPTLVAARFSLWITLFVGLLVSILILVISAISIDNFTKKLAASAATDELTGASNRRRFNEELAIVFSRFNRTGRIHSLILFDIDHFKKINDQQGHQGGDKILATISTLINSAIRPGDFFARWGGDEFAILLEGGLEECQVLINRLQTVLKNYPDWQGVAPTLSLGIGVLEAQDTQDSLVRKADRALYRAKEGGRNRFEI